MSADDVDSRQRQMLQVVHALDEALEGLQVALLQERGSQTQVCE
jgi:hypothetical protein